MSIPVLIAIIVVVIIILIVALSTLKSHNIDYVKASFVDSPWTIYGRSNGTFDEAARLAYERATVRTNPTASDHTLAASILTRNVFPETNRPDDVIALAGNHHFAAVQTLNQPTARQLEVPVGFILDTVFDFVFDDDFRVFEDLFQTRLFDNTVEAESQFINNKVQDALVEAGGVKGAAVETYVNMSIQNTNDPQNVHDSGVVSSLKSIITRIKEDGDVLPTMDDVSNGIAANCRNLSLNRPHRVADVMTVLDKISEGNFVSSIMMTDDEVLRRVWSRCFHPRNEANKDLLIQAVFDALYECMEDDITGRRYVICVTGRVTRIISSLTLLDFDERNWIIKKFEQYKNEIFTKTGTMIKQIAERISNSDSHLKKAARLYLATTQSEINTIGPVSEKDTEDFNDILRREISEMIDEYISNEDAIPPYRIESIKKEALAAIM